MALGFNQLIGKGRITVEDRNWVRVYDPNDGQESAACTFSCASGYPINAYWEKDYVHVVLSNGQNIKWSACGGANSVGLL